jgi:signal recognition particle subunit SRP54
MRERMKMVREMQSSMTNPNAQMGKKKQHTGKRLSPQEKAKLKKERDKELRKRKRDQRGG